MIIRKTIRALLLINALQFAAVIALGVVISDQIPEGVVPAVVLAAGIMTGILLFSSLITMLGLYTASRYQEKSYRESIKNLEELNLKLRAQRHDYLNHIQVIYGLMELDEYEEAKEYMEPLFQDINRMTRALKTSQPAVNALLQAKMETAEKKGIQMLVEVGTPLKKIGLEPWELCKILANLIDNADAALSEKEGEKKIEVEIRQEDNRYLFRISDNGPGIPADIREEIFEPGFTTKQDKEGHGMGLAIVSDIVKEAGGTLNFMSGIKGTTFEVRLPMEAA